MNIASRSKMCSTIVIGQFIEYYHNNVELTTKKMVVHLKNQLKNASSADYAEVIYNNEGSSSKRHWLDNYRVESFAFFVTTIYADRGYPKVVTDSLRNLGFIVDTDIKQYNSKNETCIYMVYGPVNKVLEELSKYDDQGNLLPVEEKPKKTRRKKTESEQVAA